MGSLSGSSSEPCSCPDFPSTEGCPPSPQAYLFVLYEFFPISEVLGAKLISFAHIELLGVTCPSPRLDHHAHPWGFVWALGAL